MPGDVEGRTITAMERRVFLLIAYDGTFPAVRNYYGTGGSQGYFTNQTGEYANVFEVPLPPEVDYVLLRSFDWTSYYPSTFTTRDGTFHRVVSPAITGSNASPRKSHSPRRVFSGSATRSS